MKILVIDDSDERLKQLKYSIEAALGKLSITGAELILFKTNKWRDGVKKIEETEPDIIFLDYSLDIYNQDENCSRIAEWIDRRYEQEVTVVTHTERSLEEARECFAGTECVSTFLGEKNQHKEIFFFFQKIKRAQPRKKKN